MNQTAGRIKALLDETQTQYILENKTIRRLINASVCKYVSEITELETEPDRVIVCFASKIETGTKSPTEIIELLNAINSRVVFGRFSITEQPAVFYHSSLSNISAAYSSEKIAIYFVEKEKSFLAMIILLQQYMAGELLLSNAAAEFVKQKNTITP